MDTGFRLVIEKRGQRITLDIDNNDGFEITKTAIDITDISGRRASYTKSMLLLDTPLNRFAFDIAQDFNHYTNGTNGEKFWNFNAKNKFWLYKNDEEIFKGYLILERYDKYVKKFVATGVDTTKYLYSNIETKTMNQLDLSFLDHDYTYANQQASWNGDVSLGYYYPFVDYGKKYTLLDMIGFNVPNAGRLFITDKQLTVASFVPWVYAQTIFLKIINDAGFQVGGNFIGDSRFQKLCVNYSDGSIPVGATFGVDKVFKASFQSGAFYGKQVIHNTSTATNNYQWSEWMGGPIYTGAGNGGITNGQRQGLTLNFDDETTTLQPDNQDPQGLWDSTFGGLFTQKSNENYNQRFTMNLEFYTVYPGTPDSYGLQNVDQDVFEIRVYREFDPQTGTTSPDWNRGLGFRVPMESGPDHFVFASDGWSNFVDSKDGSLDVINFENVWHDQLIGNSGQVSTPSQFYRVSITTAALDDRPDAWRKYRPLLQNERVRFTIRWRTAIVGNPTNPTLRALYPNKLWILGGVINVNNFAFNPQPLGFSSGDLMIPNSNIYNTLGKSVVPGGRVRFNSLSENYAKMTQKDFILSIIRMFNLVVIPSEEYDDVIDIYTSDYYFSNEQVYKDWSRKINNNMPQNLSYNLDDNLKHLFTYKDDNDYYNSIYQDEFNEAFGSQIWRIAADDDTYKTTTKVIESAFSQSPMVKLKGEEDNSLSNFVFPVIFKDLEDQKEKPYLPTNMRIAIRKPGLLQFSAPKQVGYYDHLSSPKQQYITGFPYIGYLDDPLYPTFDISFGPPQVQFYTSNNYTANNLFTSYWERQMQELTSLNARMLTCEMLFTPQDIKDLRFNDIIILNIDGGTQYWRINKISKINITVYDRLIPAEVELIRILDTEAPGYYSQVRQYQTNGLQAGYNGSGLGARINYPANQTSTSYKNYIATSPNGNINIGNNTTAINNTNNITIGNGNSIFGLTNKAALGNGIIMQPDYGISNQTFIQGAITPYINIIDAGDGVVLPIDGVPGLPTLIDAGAGIPLPIDGQSPVNLITSFNQSPFGV